MHQRVPALTPYQGGNSRKQLKADRSATAQAVLLGLEVDPAPGLAAAGAAPELLRYSENRMSFHQNGLLMAEAAAQSGCPQIGILTGLHGGLRSHGLVGRLMATAPTVREAILDFCVNEVRFVRGAVTHCTTQSGLCLWTYAIQAPPLRGMDIIVDQAAGLAVSMLHELCGLHPEEVHLSHATPGDPSAYRRAFGTPVIFDADQTCLVLLAEVLDAPVRTADPALRSILQRQVLDYWARGQPTAAEQARPALAAHVTNGEPTLETIAEALGVAPRTLNRRLQAEGTSFREVLDQARHDIACQLLDTTRISVTEIGMALGYATPLALCAPSAAVRDNHRASGGARAR